MSDDGDEIAVFLCDGAVCSSRTAVQALRARLAALVRERGWHGRVVLDRETCFGHCKHGPNLMVCRSDVARMGPPAPGTAGAELHHEVTADSAASVLAAWLSRAGADGG